MIYVYNLGIPGENSKYLLERFENEILSRWEKEDGELIIIIAIGINDSYYIKPEKKPKISIEEFEKNLKILLKNIMKFTENIIFIGLTKVDEKIISQWDVEKAYKNKYISDYNSVIEDFCRKNRLFFIPVLDLLKDFDLEDRLHPNSQGHEKLFNKIKDFLIQEKII